jgi:uncharacterized protein (DUF885 family)
MTVKNPIIILTLMVAVSACDSDSSLSTSPSPAAIEQPPLQSLQAPTESVDEFFTRFTDVWMEGNPNMAISSVYFSDEKQDQMEVQLTPLTREYELSRIELAKEGLAELAQLDLSQAGETQRVSAAVMKWQLEMRVANEPYLDYIFFPLRQFFGAPDSLVSSFTIRHPFQNARDVENYVQRLGLVGTRMQEATYDMRERAEKDIHPPTFIINATIDNMQNFVSSAPAENPFITTLMEKTESMADLTAAERTRLIDEATRIVENQVYPAWQAGIAQLQGQLPRSTDVAGVSRFPTGEAVYAQQLRAYTTTELSADEIHQIGLNEVDRIESEMIDLFNQIDITEGTIPERVAELRTRLAYPVTDEGRAAMMADLQRILADAKVRSAALFDVVPSSDVIVQPYPEFMWQSAAASYSSPPLDGTRPGIFQMPLRQNRLTRFETRTLVYHETVPGHHFQLALVNENEELPRFMRVGAYGGNSAIVEGWALYSERLAAESGWYEGDIEGLLGQLNSALFRARRLVVDTGLHTKGWTRQQAIDYGMPPSEVDRYVSWPGQATSYMIGQLKIVELRDRAQAALGDEFVFNDFHNVVLGAGIVPLVTLESLVDDYIAEKVSN